MATKRFAKGLRRAQRVLYLEARAACLSHIECGLLCYECQTFVMGVVCRPRDYIELPGGRLKVPMPACGGADRR